jgi:hypothetical protein
MNINKPLIRYQYTLTSSNKTDWIKHIVRWTETLRQATFEGDCVKVILEDNVTKNRFSPFHIVTLSCFIELIKRKGYLVYLEVYDNELHDLIYNDISLTLYWTDCNRDHVDSPDSSRLNLWRITQGRQYEYEASVHQYFTNKFPGIDFFMLKSCLTELYYNVFDHAEANGIAFSYIHYDDEEEVIHIAICDFGKGIAKTIKDAYRNISDDKEALIKSLERGVTSKSNTHNAGFGLDNIISALSNSTLRIVSNNAILFYRKNGEISETKTYDMPFCLNGTLIYFDLPVSGFENTEIRDEFTF